MSVIAATDCQIFDLAPFMQQLDFGIVQDNGRRVVIYVDHQIHGNTHGKVLHDETKFHRQQGRIVANSGPVSDQTARVVEALEQFIWHPFDRYDGIRISSAFDKAGYQSKIVIKLGYGYAPAEVCYAVAKAMFRTCFNARISYHESDTLSELEAMDREIDCPIPAYAVSH